MRYGLDYEQLRGDRVLFEDEVTSEFLMPQAWILALDWPHSRLC